MHFGTRTCNVIISPADEAIQLQRVRFVLEQQIIFDEIEGLKVIREILRDFQEVAARNAVENSEIGSSRTESTCTAFEEIHFAEVLLSFEYLHDGDLAVAFRGF